MGEKNYGRHYGLEIGDIVECGFIKKRRYKVVGFTLNNNEVVVEDEEGRKRELIAEHCVKIKK